MALVVDSHRQIIKAAIAAEFKIVADTTIRKHCLFGILPGGSFCTAWSYHIQGIPQFSRSVTLLRIGVGIQLGQNTVAIVLVVAIVFFPIRIQVAGVGLHRVSQAVCIRITNFCRSRKAVVVVIGIKIIGQAVLVAIEERTRMKMLPAADVWI